MVKSAFSTRLLARCAYYTKLSAPSATAPCNSSAAARFDAAKRGLGIAYFPHASVGWDNNPRFPKEVKAAAAVGSTPEKFEHVLRRAKDWLDRNPQPGMPKLITVNAWNEWTEGSYLEPDTVNGLGYLEAVRRVFGAGGE